MANLKKNVLLMYFFLALISSIPVYPQSTSIGCCTNPGASPLIRCFPDQLIDENLCCPKPKEQNPQYYASPNGPTDPASCLQNFFFPGKGCAEISVCSTSGCCCSASPFGGSIKQEIDCKGQGQTFDISVTNPLECSQRCQIPQCRDNKDNDGDGCTDLDDSICTSQDVQIESGGDCKVQPPKCNDPNYKPKISDLIITPVKGKAGFSLRWKDECIATSYDILRCKGSCSNFQEIAESNTNSFDDKSINLIFDLDKATLSPYTYQIKAQYSNGKTSDPITKTANLGNLECLEQFSNNPFCIHASYYDRYKTYLISNFPSEFTESSFSNKVTSKFGTNFNKAFYCDESNKLNGPSLSCPSQQVCVVSNNQPSCLRQVNCKKESANPFGMYSTLQNCESNAAGEHVLCFYDRSHTIVNSCFNCNPSMACYDYKTGEACARDNCRIGNGNCIWKSLESQIGAGVCINKNDYNCQWCDKKGTETLENLRSFNEVFDLCTRQKSDLLSEGSFKCYFNKDISTNCNKIVCTDYEKEECKNEQINHNENNAITNPSNDRCGIKVCQNIGNKCVKNADGDYKSEPDCTTRECESDYFAPVTTITPKINSKGIYKELNIEIFDKTNVNGVNASILATDYANYITFFCVEPHCNPNGHPYINSTKSSRIILSGLNAFDSVTGLTAFTLQEGQNTIRYYSQDPAKNIGEVKKITIEAHKNATGPVIFAVTIPDSQKIIDKIYTHNSNPNIDVEFFEPAIITSAKLTNRKTGASASLQLTNALSKTTGIPVGQTLIDGEYILEINAKNQNNVFMDPTPLPIIVIDTQKPTLNIIPSDNKLITDKSIVAFKLEFNEEVNLTSVKLDLEEANGNFTTTNKSHYVAAIAMKDGSHILEVLAQDYAGNEVTGSISFVVDVNPLVIKLIKPKFGTASSHTFDIIVETDNVAECRYSFKNEFSFDSMTKFTSTGAIQHTISNFNKIPAGDT